MSIGKTIQNDFAVWTLLSEPVFAHTRPGTTEKVYKVAALCEPKDESFPEREVDLFLDETDLASLA